MNHASTSFTVCPFGLDVIIDLSDKCSSAITATGRFEPFAALFFSPIGCFRAQGCLFDFDCRKLLPDDGFVLKNGRSGGTIVTGRSRPVPDDRDGCLSDIQAKQAQDMNDLFHSYSWSN